MIFITIYMFFNAWIYKKKTLEVKLEESGDLSTGIFVLMRLKKKIIIRD